MPTARVCVLCLLDQAVSPGSHVGSRPVAGSAVALELLSGSVQPEWPFELLERIGPFVKLVDLRLWCCSPTSPHSRRLRLPLSGLRGFLFAAATLAQFARLVSWNCRDRCQLSVWDFL